MRLIDADAIPYTMLYKENWLAGTGMEKQGAWKDDIEAMPTIEERKTGKWNGAQNVECDQCGHLYPAFMRLEKYCPNCGARMEVGHE